jgi:hypothetical protein
VKREEEASFCFIFEGADVACTRALLESSTTQYDPILAELETRAIGCDVSTTSESGTELASVEGILDYASFGH